MLCVKQWQAKDSLAYIEDIQLSFSFRSPRITSDLVLTNTPRKACLLPRVEQITSVVVFLLEQRNQHLLLLPKKHSKLNWFMINLKSNQNTVIYSMVLGK